MGNGLVAASYISICTILGILAARSFFPEHSRELTKAGICWLIVSCLVFILRSGALFTIMSAIVMWYLAPKHRAGVVLFFLVMLPALPIWVSWLLGVPGIPYVTEMTHVKLAILAILGAGMVATRQDVCEISNHDQKMWLYCLAFLMLTAALDFRGNTVTHGLRLGLDTAIFGLMLFFFTHRVRGIDVSKAALVGLVFAGMMLALVGIAQLALNWFIYSDIPNEHAVRIPSYHNAFRSRDGSPRIPGTMKPIPFGMYMAICATIAVYFWRNSGRKIMPLGLMGFFFIAILLSGSRGALLQLAAGIGLWWLFSPAFSESRKALVLFGSILGLILIPLIINWLLVTDEYNTFAYRLELIENSALVISENPLFGSPDYLSNEAVKQSIQGQGIVDVVNAYLAIVLEYGFVGLALMLVPAIATFRRLTRARSMAEKLGETGAEMQCRIFIALLGSYLLSFANISLVDRVYEYYWIIVLLGSALATTVLTSTKDTKEMQRRGFGQFTASKPGVGGVTS